MLANAQRFRRPRSSPLTQADWILVADTNTARHVTNAVIQRYLVPDTQVGVSIPVATDGQVGEVHVAIRPLLPGAACQWCQELIDPSELALEAQPGPDRGQRHDRDRAVQEHHENAPHSSASARQRRRSRTADAARPADADDPIVNLPGLFPAAAA